MTDDNLQGQKPGIPETEKLQNADVSGSAQKKLKNARQWRWLNPQPEPPLPTSGRFGRLFMLTLMGVVFALIIGCGALFAMGPGRPLYENVALSLGIDLGSVLLGGDQGGTPTPIGEPSGTSDGTCFSSCTPGVTKCQGILTCQTRDDGSHICYDEQFCSCHTDGTCDPDEASVCPDCKPAPCTCGDGQCQADCQEDAQSCPADCSGPTQSPYVPPPTEQPPAQPTPVCSCTCTDTCLPLATCPKCLDSCTGAACTP